MKNVQVRIRDEEDTLTWAKNKATRMYSTKIGYKSLKDPPSQDDVWWWSKIWKIKAPKKICFPIASTK
jgi:hypothetical protein